MVYIIRTLLLSSLLLMSLAALADSDHPLVSAYPEASIYSQSVVNYAEVILPQHKVTTDTPFAGISVIGKQTGHIYNIKGNHSALHVAENYLDVVKRLKAKLLLVCRSDCGFDFSKKLLRSSHWTKSIFSGMQNFSQGQDEHYYILAQLGDDAAPTYLQWFIKPLYGNKLELGQIITEPQQLQLGLVKINESAITSKPTASTASKGLGPDSAEGGDHPLISRYAGAKLTHRTDTEFTEVRLATGIADKNKQVPHLTLAGKSTLLHYKASKDQSTLQVFRNYQQALQEAGFTIVFSCEHKSCGDNQLKHLWQGSPDRHRFKGYLSNSTNADDDYRMLTAHKEVNGKDTYLSIYVLKNSEHSNVDIAHDIVELSSMKTDRVSIDSTYLQNQLMENGKVVLHGLHFASDSAQLLPESTDALTVILSYLKQHPKQSFYVVGHTDNTGSHEHNMQLSDARATSVVNELKKQGITAERLFAAGVGPMSPLQKNNTEQHKANNRRVELVLR